MKVPRRHPKHRDKHEKNLHTEQMSVVFPSGINILFEVILCQWLMIASKTLQLRHEVPVLVLSWWTIHGYKAAATYFRHQKAASDWVYTKKLPKQYMCQMKRVSLISLAGWRRGAHLANCKYCNKKQHWELARYIPEAVLSPLWPPFTSSTGCISFLHLIYQILELQGRISVLYQICVKEHIINPLVYELYCYKHSHRWIILDCPVLMRGNFFCSQVPKPLHCLWPKRPVPTCRPHWVQAVQFSCLPMLSTLHLLIMTWHYGDRESKCMATHIFYLLRIVLSRSSSSSLASSAWHATSCHTGDQQLKSIRSKALILDLDQMLLPQLHICGHHPECPSSCG